MTVANAFEIRRENLRRLVLDKFEGNRAAFARAASVHQNQINLLLSDNEQHRRNMGEALARRLESELQLSEGYFDAAQRGGAGSTFLIKSWDVPEPLLGLLRNEHVTESTNWYEAFLNTLAGKITSKESLTFARVATHDMAPEVAFDDRVLIDTGVKAVSSDGVYILQRGNDLFLRRVTKSLAGGWTIHAPSAAIEAVKADNLKGIKAVGRIVMVVRDTIL